MDALKAIKSREGDFIRKFMPEYDGVSRLPSVVVVSYEASSEKERVGFLDRHGELTFMEVWGNPIARWLSA